MYLDTGLGTPTLWRQVILVAEYLNILCLTKNTLNSKIGISSTPCSEGMLNHAHRVRKKKGKTN